MEILAITLGIISFVLLLYIIHFQTQLKSINRQLTNRLTQNTAQPVSLSLINKELNELAANINKCLKAEEQLRLNTEREEKKFKEMIANISHDLRTPLTAIKGYLQLIERGKLEDVQLQKFIIIKKHTEELEQLVNRFFEYSYFISKDEEPQIEKINLTNLIADNLVSFVSQFERKGLLVSFAQTTPVYIHADRTMTTRIVENLIRNCLAHSAGDIDVSITKNTNVTLIFKNPVKEPSQINPERLFDRFYTGDMARTQTTGIGLSIVKLLSEQMGGKSSACIKENMLYIQVEFPE